MHQPAYAGRSPNPFTLNSTGLKLESSTLSESSNDPHTGRVASAYRFTSTRNLLQFFRHLAAVARPQRVDRVGAPDVRRDLLQVPGDLHQAADVAGEHRLRPGRRDVRPPCGRRAARPSPAASGCSCPPRRSRVRSRPAAPASSPGIISRSCRGCLRICWAWRRWQASW